MTERRQDDRVQVGKDCNLYIAGIYELPAVVKDISEIGIAFELPFSQEVYEKVNEVGELKFTYLDEFLFLGTEQCQVLTASCNIVRVSKTDNSMLIGCTLRADEEIRQYVSRKKVSEFMKIVSPNRGTFSSTKKS